MVELEALTPGHLNAFEGLLGSEDFGGCFCAVWTAFGEDWGARCGDPARPNLAVTRGRVGAGEHVGFLVRHGGDFVAWTGAGPKSCFPLVTSRLASRLTPASDDVWVIGCLAVAAAHRGKGLPEAIVGAVGRRALGAGARALEAYPTRPWDEPRSYRGSLALYARCGFVEAGAEADGEGEIVLMRRDLV